MNSGPGRRADARTPDRPDRPASGSATPGGSTSGKVAAGLLLALVLLPLLYVAWLQPTLYGPFVLVFVLTGVGVLVFSRRARRKGAGGRPRG